MRNEHLISELKNRIIAEFCYDHANPQYTACSIYRLLHYCFRYLYKEDPLNCDHHIKITKNVIEYFINYYSAIEREQIDWILSDDSMNTLHSIFIYDMEVYIHRESNIKVKKVMYEVIDKVCK